MITRAHTTQPPSLVADLFVAALLGAFLYGLIRVAQHWQAPLQPQVDISLSLWALPGYTLLSFLRGLAAYLLSLLFALAYGYVAAHRPRAERIMLPLLDILQSIPVLGFLPGVVLALVALFPQNNIGLELACILMIFTGQVWNMTFSFYQSLRAIPVELREASALYQFNWWQRFRRVELPASAVGLAWNSMMAMAGGWFFLMVCEAFTLGAHDFRLPGLGAYMSVAIARHDFTAMVAGIGAMVGMIVLVDAGVWRPLLVWTQKFRLEDTAAPDAQGSRVLQWLRGSWLVSMATTHVAHPISEWLAFQANPAPQPPAGRLGTGRRAWLPRCMSVVLLGACAAVTLWAAWRFTQLIGQMPGEAWLHVLTGAGLTLARVTLAVLLGSLWMVPMGIWIGRSDRRRSRLQPFVQVAASFPAPMLYPLVLLALDRIGIGLGAGAVLLMLLGTQWYLLFNVIAGASSVPADLRDVADAYRFTSRQRWWKVWWPAIFPYLITGWVTAAGGAWNASIVAEYVSVGSQVFVAPGLGSLISTAASQGHFEVLAAGVLTMSLVVVVINRLIWKPFYRLAETRYAY